MNARRTDLALEARELAGDGLRGVESREETREGYPCVTVEVTTEEGARALGKPMGCYHTLDLTALNRQTDALPRAARAVSSLLLPLLPKGEGTVLVVGLGNRAMTVDAVGVLTAEGTLATRHLVDSLPDDFGGLRPVAVLKTGVLGTTGVESGELVRALCEQIHPDGVIAVDALCARKVERLCATVQISDTGIVPGSGVGNHRFALNRDSLGAPVIAVGVPTVIEGATLCADLLEQAGATPPPELTGGTLFVTPRDIDSRVKELARVLSLGIGLALQPTLTVEDLELLSG